jgi:uncharacterized membrane protein YraQ (UPF0718 family)
MFLPHVLKSVVTDVSITTLISISFINIVAIATLSAILEWKYDLIYLTALYIIFSLLSQYESTRGNLNLYIATKNLLSAAEENKKLESDNRSKQIKKVIANVADELKYVSLLCPTIFSFRNTFIQNIYVNFIL